MNPRKTSSGFTLMEVAVAGALVALLSACVFRGILTVKQNSQALAQRIAAQGVCMHRYEEMKSIAWDLVDESTFPATNVLLASLNRDPTKGRLEAEISNVITPDVQDGVNLKKADITCTWTFRGRTHSEVLHGVIVDGYSTYAEMGSLSGSLVLNPTYARPQMFYARGVDGSTYTQLDLDTMPSSFNATTVVVMPGGGGKQTFSFNGANRTVSNEKTVAFTAGGLDDPISVSVSKSVNTIEIDEGGSEEVTVYTLGLSCGQSSFSYK